MVQTPHQLSGADLTQLCFLGCSLHLLGLWTSRCPSPEPPEIKEKSLSDLAFLKPVLTLVFQSTVQQTFLKRVG